MTASVTLKISPTEFDAVRLALDQAIKYNADLVSNIKDELAYYEGKKLTDEHLKDKKASEDAWQRCQHNVLQYQALERKFK